MPSHLRTSVTLLAFTFALAENPRLSAQAPSVTASPGSTQPTAAPAQDTFQAEQARIHAETVADYDNMLGQLGLTREQMRPGANGSPTGPHPVNYDEAKVPPYTLPDPLVLPNGKPVHTPGQWWTQRRPELLHLLEASMYGRIPANTPSVHWTVDSNENSTVSGTDATTQKLTGHVDNAADPSITVNIDVELTLPAHPKGKVPVIVAFDWPASFWAEMAKRTGRTMPVPKGPTAREEVLAKGWGYALFIPTTVQADNGAGLTSGIIGLTNHGAHRTPDQWGALRAWGWGASRLLDYFETQPSIDARRVGIFGHSRYGKAALVTMAFDPRFAIGYISSSGEAGAKVNRRHFGELLENVAGDEEYHWMAGNFLRYASTQTANDLPVDAHDLIALCAPRAVFLSAGATKGDGWVDAHGQFDAAVAAAPVYKLLANQDLGTATFPPTETEIGQGLLAFRQHPEGHTPAPNWPFFLTFAERELYGPDFALDLKAQ